MRELTKDEQIEFWWEMYAAAHSMGLRSNTKPILEELGSLGVFNTLRIEFKSQTKDGDFVSIIEATNLSLPE